MSSGHGHYMSMALDLAMKARDDVAPNPRVGAVIVKDGAVVGKGYHQRPGLPHAEVLALRSAGDRARGGTLYVNLEPCCHLNKRTPPCSREILSSGVKRVVISLFDPNPHVSGKGIDELRRGGVEVETGLHARKAFEVNRGFLSLMKNGRPFLTVKGAASLDGKIATVSGDSQWISGGPSLKYAHQLRQEHDGILVGVGTVLKDNPLLTTRLPGKRKVHHPVRIILDSLGRTPPDSRLFDTLSESPVWIMSGDDAPGERLEVLEKRGARIFRVPRGHTREECALRSLMEILVQERVLTLLVEGGARVTGSFLRERLVDSIRLVLAPLVIGGQDAIGWVGGRSPERLVDTFRFSGPLHTRHLGEDLLVSVDLWNETCFMEKTLSKKG